MVVPEQEFEKLGPPGSALGGNLTAVESDAEKGVSFITITDQAPDIEALLHTAEYGAPDELCVKIIYEIGLGTDVPLVKRQVGEAYREYQKAFWEDFETGTGFNIDKLTDELYDDPQMVEHEGCSLLVAISKLRNSAKTRDTQKTVSEADRIARVLVRKEIYPTT